MPRAATAPSSPWVLADAAAWRSRLASGGERSRARSSGPRCLALAGLVAVTLLVAAQMSGAAYLLDSAPLDVRVVTTVRQQTPVGNMRRGGAPREDIQASREEADPAAYLASLPPPPPAPPPPALEGEAPERASLPRTSLRPYNELRDDRRYLLYTPSGGFNNQLICLIGAVHLAQRFNRTLLVPPNGRHSSLFWNYYRLTDKQVAPMDQALDFAHMEAVLGVELVPLNVTLRQFRTEALGLRGAAETSARALVIPIPQNRNLRHNSLAHAERVAALAAESSKQVVFFYGAFYNRYWLQPEIQRAVRYAPYIRMFSKAIADSALGGRFNAFHIRLGDKSELARKLSHDGSYYVQAAARAGFGRDAPTYVATDEKPGSAYVAPLTAAFRNVTFGNELKRLPALKSWFRDYHARVPRSQLRGDLFGLVEQLVCVRANRFVGSALSSFTETIAFARSELAAALPDLLPTKDRVTATILWNGKFKVFLGPEA